MSVHRYLATALVGTIAPAALLIAPAAQRHTVDMAQDHYVGHTGSNGSTMVDRFEAAGYTGWSSLAENVAAGQATAAGVVKAWMKSPGHRANILNCSLKHIGVGYVKASGSAGGPYWTQDFGVNF
ncbi:CAP domain-containing protein [Streptomyces sp. NPDC047085]|uniref:CAP domain-containing protein n=1 Tax=Streptomyces sp. NPDC047085 TaxID=3155140 RepID=UPI0033D888C7